MNPLASAVALFKRHYHSYGHSVHSPLAYRIVTDVLYPKRIYAMYAYHDIELACRQREAGSSLYRELCRMARILNFFNPDEILFSEGCGCDGITVARIITPKANVSTAERGKSTVLYPNGKRWCMLKCGERRRVWLVKGMPYPEQTAFFSTISNGIWLSGRKNAIFIEYEDIHKVSYTLPL